MQKHELIEGAVYATIHNSYLAKWFGKGEEFKQYINNTGTPMEGMFSVRKYEELREATAEETQKFNTLIETLK